MKTNTNAVKMNKTGFWKTFTVNGRNGRRIVFAGSKDLAVRAYTEAGNAAEAVKTAYGFVGEAK